MAEIKSTMQMVLERAARMEQQATGATHAMDKTKEGMRFAASYMNDTENDLAQLLEQQQADEQQAIRGGMVQTLLRNILLPRDEALQATSKKALNGLLAISLGQDQIATICAELQQIIDQYGQHKEQTTEQLETALCNQIEQQQAARGEEVDPQNISARMHPQYTSKLAEMLAGLNDQYNQALDQRKSMIQHILTSGV